MSNSIEIKGEEESDLDLVVKMTKPCQAAFKRNWQGFKAYYESYPEALFYSLAVNTDTAFHIAASSGNTNVLRGLLAMVEHSRIGEVLAKLKDDHENTVLHEAATTDNVDAATLLVEKLWTSCNDQAVEVDQALKVRNKLGETPLYRAAALGNTRMVKYLAGEIEKVNENIRSHYYRYDTMSILHIAVLGYSRSKLNVKLRYFMHAY